MDVAARPALRSMLTKTKSLKKVPFCFLMVFVIMLLPGMMVSVLFSGDFLVDKQSLQQYVEEHLSPEDIEQLEMMERTMSSISEAMTNAQYESAIKEAQVLYLLALGKYEDHPDLVPRLVACFSAEQTDEKLIETVNREFGTSIETQDYINVMKSVRSVYVDVSRYVDPDTKNNLDLVEWAIAAEKAGWGYVWGTYGRVLTNDLLRSKINQYPEELTNLEQYIRSHYLNIRTTDCVGLIKGYSWFDPQTQTIHYASNGMPDTGANSMFKRALEKGPIDTIPEIPGLLVWMEGHVGIYIGSGEVIEARGVYHGVVRTKLSERKWEAWAKIKYITYMEESG